MNIVKILAIGNSFSEDAVHYLYQMASSLGIDIKVVNLFIGGCSLERHWKNIENNEKAYLYQINGFKTERCVSIEEMLETEEWDYIVTQQASHDSGWLNSYEPFIGLMVEYLKKKAPSAQIMLQETWAYEINSSHGGFMRYNRSQQEMYQKIHKAYTTMERKYGLRLIPSGSVIQKVRQLPEFCIQEGGISLCRDGFHLSFDYGRYLVTCVWLKTIFGINAKDITYFPESPNLTGIPEQKLLDILKDVVDLQE